MWKAERFVYMTSEINATTLTETVASIHAMIAQSSEPIVLWIASDGGSFVHSMALVQAIRTCSVPVHTVGFGFVASGAVMVLAAGNMRYALPRTSFMSHQPSCGGEGDVHYREREREWGYDQWMYKQMLEIFREHSLLPNAKIKRLLLSTSYYYSEIEALKYGLIDEILMEVRVENTGDGDLRVHGIAHSEGTTGGGPSGDRRGQLEQRGHGEPAVHAKRRSQILQGRFAGL